MSMTMNRNRKERRGSGGGCSWYLGLGVAKSACRSWRQAAHGGAPAGHAHGGAPAFFWSDRAARRVQASGAAAIEST